jgi:hypothetical protein
LECVGTDDGGRSKAPDIPPELVYSSSAAKECLFKEQVITRWVGFELKQADQLGSSISSARMEDEGYRVE